MTQDDGGTARAMLERIGLTLPADARVEHAAGIDGQDDAARLILLLPEASSRAFVAALGKRAGTPPDFSADQNFHLGPPEDGFRPADATGLKTAQLPWAGGNEALNVGIAPAGEGRVRLFLVWHQL